VLAVRAGGVSAVVAHPDAFHTRHLGARLARPVPTVSTDCPVAVAALDNAVYAAPRVARVALHREAERALALARFAHVVG
jgi:hypothetical protein